MWLVWISWRATVLMVPCSPAPRPRQFQKDSLASFACFTILRPVPAPSSLCTPPTSSSLWSSTPSPRRFRTAQPSSQRVPSMCCTPSGQCSSPLLSDHSTPSVSRISARFVHEMKVLYAVSRVKFFFSEVILSPNCIDTHNAVRKSLLG